MRIETPRHLLSSDRPITSFAGDLLGRSEFAESLASAIKGWTGNGSLVIALYGPWGSGKSSIKIWLLNHFVNLKGNVVYCRIQSLAMGRTGTTC